MIQFEPDGRAPEPPVKSSANTVVQPDSGGGMDADAGKVSGMAMSAAPTRAPRANRVEVRERWGIGGDLLVEPDLLRVTTKPVTRRPPRAE